MLKIRVIKTASSAKAVQVIRYQNNKRVVVKHFGSTHTESELDELLKIASEWINDHTSQLSIFPDDNPNTILHINHCSFLGVHYTFFYELISELQRQIGFTQLEQPLLNDLVTIRLLEPASKLRSINLLENYFGIKQHRKKFL